jgi:NAD-dependent SIR2 family protein deacetylase
VDFAEFDRQPGVAAIPSCPAYQWHVVDAAAARIRLLICVGTSLAVGVTSFLQSAAADAGATAFLVDPGERPRDAHRSMVHVRARAEELLPEACGILTTIA